MSNESEQSRRISLNYKNAAQTSESILEELYNNDDNFNQFTSKQSLVRFHTSKFDPYQDARKLVQADRIPYCSKKAIDYENKPSQSQTFQKSEDLLKLCTMSNESTTIDQEILELCEAAEYVSQSIQERSETPRRIETVKSISIADAILNDFCGNLSPETKIPQPEYLSPDFRFKNKDIRTYSRKRHLQFENDNDSKQDSYTSCNPTITTSNEKFKSVSAPQKSIATKNILLNLSDHFSQNLEMEKNSSQIHHSCTSPTHSVENLHDLEELASPIKQISHEKHNNDISIIDGSNLVINSNEISQSIKDETIFSENEDEWNADCDLFLNLKTQEVLQKIDTTENKDHIINCFNIETQETFQTPANMNKTVEQQSVTFHKTQVTDIKMNKKISKSITKNIANKNTGYFCDNSQTDRKTSLRRLPKANEKQNNIQILIEKIISLRQKYPPYSIQNIPDCDEFLGFETRDSDSIDLDNNKDGLHFKTMTDANLEENKTIVKNELLFDDDDDSDSDIFFNLKTQDVMREQSSSVYQTDNFVGFQTASSKHIKISEQALQQAEKILQELPNLPALEEENNKFDIPSKISSNRNNKQEEDNVENVDKFVGFKTASLKALKVSDAAKKRALKILEDLPELPGPSNRNLNAIQKTSNTTFNGFQTASMKKVEISKEAEIRANKILQDLPELPILNASNEKILESNFKNSSFENMQLSEWPYDIEDEKTDLNKEILKEVKQTFLGFRTASEKTIKISEKAKQMAANILSELPEIAIKRKYINEINNQTNENSMKHEDIQLSEMPLNDKLENVEKRKAGEFDKPFTRSAKKLRKTKTEECLAKVILHQDNIRESESSVNILPSHTSLISRRNLLSLTKQRRRATISTIISRNDAVDSVAIETPNKNEKLLLKSNKESNISSPITPNLRKFFSSTPDSSTPKQKTLTECSKENDSMDNDFKHINWDSCNDSTNNELKSNIKFNESISINVTYSDMNPSPRQRIEKLRMYGKAPDISPIQVTNYSNFRTPGLRRTRSNSKKVN